MTFEEMAAVVSEAHNYRRKVTGHCRANQGIKNALRAGFDCLEHGTFMDDEALDMLLERDIARRARPCSSSTRASSTGPAFGMPQSVIDGHKETLEGGRRERPDDPPGRRPARDGRRLRVRLEPARRLRQGADVLRPHVGFTPLETITCATRTGAEIMGRGHEFGTVEPGKLADLLVVDGDVARPTSPCSKTARGSSP